MTFEEIQAAIQQMLAVQRELQASHLRLTERHATQQAENEQFYQQTREAIRQLLAGQRELQESQLRLSERQATQQSAIDNHEQWLENMRQVAQEIGERQIRRDAEQTRQERILNQLIGYSLSNESEHLDFEERMRRLEQRIEEVRGGQP